MTYNKLTDSGIKRFEENVLEDVWNAMDSGDYPKPFRTFEEARALGWKYQFEHKGAYYWIYFDECFDVYEEE